MALETNLLHLIIYKFFRNSKTFNNKTQKLHHSSKVKFKKMKEGLQFFLMQILC